MKFSLSIRDTCRGFELIYTERGTGNTCQLKEVSFLKRDDIINCFKATLKSILSKKSFKITNSNMLSSYYVELDKNEEYLK